jgi:hypothetical protein
MGYSWRLMEPERPAAPHWISRWLPAAAILALAAPTLFLAYLPMTDLPQHTAVVSMLQHIDDPRFGFSEFYALAPGRTLYFLTYAVALGLAKFLPLALAMRVVVFLSVIAYPFGVLAVLRATGRAGILALLALPLMYNRAFFWGFINFNLALGMSLLVLALLVRPTRSVRSDLALAAVCTAVAFTHVYGIALVLGTACVWLAIGERRALLRRALPLAPIALGALAWLALGHRAEGRGELYFLPGVDRFLGFEDATLGGYPDRSDELLFGLMLGAVAVFCARTFPWSRKRWRALGHCERILCVVAVLNFALYWALPTHTETAYFIHFRHALLAVALLPMIASDRELRASPIASRALLAVLTASTFAIHWSHLVRFDREARPFDRVVAMLPDAPKLYFLSWDLNGSVIQTSPYHHFHAYVQARRGGLISFSFPEMFWNIPIRMRDDAGVPRRKQYSEWRPQEFDYDNVGYFYDYVLVRTSRREHRGVETLRKFPYELFYSDPPWELYRRIRDAETPTPADPGPTRDAAEQPGGTRLKADPRAVP